MTLICPGTNIQGAAGAAFGKDIGEPGTDTHFAQINPPFKDSIPGNIGGRIYNTDEKFLRDSVFQCSCLTEGSITAISNVYGLTPEAAHGTYTELESSRTVASTPFVGFTSVFTVGSSLNIFFSRMSNGNRDSLDGSLTFSEGDGNCSGTIKPGSCTGR